MQLVLSLFPGIGLLDMAFEQEGFCVVRGPDVLWGGDIRRFHPPAGKFDGVIGGPPCQCFSRLAHMVRQNGYEPKFGNLIPEFERCVTEAYPQWFVMENVPDAPVPFVHGGGYPANGYPGGTTIMESAWSIHTFTLNNRRLGETQNRVRRWSFGNKWTFRPLMINTVALEKLEFEYAACGGHGTSISGGLDRRRKKQCRLYNQGFHNIKSNGSFRELCRKQGLPSDFDLPSFTVAAKCKAVGNGVPLAMGRAIARAVKKAIGEA